MLVKGSLLVTYFVCIQHAEVLTHKRFPHYWPFVRVIHRSPVDSPDTGLVMRSFDVSLFVSMDKLLKKTIESPVVWGDVTLTKSVRTIVWFQVFMFLWLPAANQEYVDHIIYGAWGLLDAVWGTQPRGMAIYSVSYTDSKDPRFDVDRGVQPEATSYTNKKNRRDSFIGGQSLECGQNTTNCLNTTLAF